MSSSFRSGRDAGAEPGAGGDASATRSSAPPAAGGSNPPESDAGDSIAWWDIKESRDPSPAIQLRAIAEIALAIDAARSPNLPRGGATLHPHGALITWKGRAKVLPDLPLAALGDEERVFAPEIKSGGKPDARSDIFALGAMLFEALSGRDFEDGAEVQQALEDLRASKQSGEDASPPWYEDLLSLAARATHANPSARGPQPKVIAKEILRLGGVDVAAPETLAALVTESHSMPPPATRRRSSSGGVQAVRTSSRPDGRYKSEPPAAEVVKGTRKSSRPPSSSKPSSGDPRDAATTGSAESTSSRPTVPGGEPEDRVSKRPTVPGSAPDGGETRAEPARATSSGAPSAQRGGPSAAASSPATAVYSAMKHAPSTGPLKVESRVPTRTGLRSAPESPRPATPVIPPAGKVPSRVPTTTGMPLYRPAGADGRPSTASTPPASAGRGPAVTSTPPPVAVGVANPAPPAGPSSPPPSPSSEAHGDPSADRRQASVSSPPSVLSGSSTGAPAIVTLSPRRRSRPPAQDEDSPARSRSSWPPAPDAPRPAKGRDAQHAQRQKMLLLSGAAVVLMLAFAATAVLGPPEAPATPVPDVDTKGEAPLPPELRTPPELREPLLPPEPLPPTPPVDNLVPPQPEPPTESAAGAPVPPPPTPAAPAPAKPPQFVKPAPHVARVPAAPAAAPAKPPETDSPPLPPPLATELHAEEPGVLPGPPPPLAPTESKPQAPAPPREELKPPAGDYGI